MMKTAEILTIPIHHITMGETLDTIQLWMDEDEPRLHQICTANPEFVMMAQNDEPFRTVLLEADLNIADGIGLVIASKLQGRPLPERIAGSELVYHLAEQCAEHGWRLFLLGAMEGVAEKAAAVLTTLYPDLIIAGTHAGSPLLVENDEIVRMVNGSAADVLYVAYGAPKQDKWIARNRDTLTTVRVAIGVGGALDFIAGVRKRAPVWVQEVHLEWLYRLVQQPSRWRRMLALPRFIWAIMKDEG